MIWANSHDDHVNDSSTNTCHALHIFVVGVLVYLVDLLWNLNPSFFQEFIDRDNFE